MEDMKDNYKLKRFLREMLRVSPIGVEAPEENVDTLNAEEYLLKPESEQNPEVSEKALDKMERMDPGVDSQGLKDYLLRKMNQ